MTTHEGNRAGLAPCSSKGGDQRHFQEYYQQRQMVGAPSLILEKSVIIHKDENGFGLRITGQAPVIIEHVHENSAAWRAGVRVLDTICKVNGVPVDQMDHKGVVLLFKNCNRFVALTLISAVQDAGGGGGGGIGDQQALPTCALKERVCQLLNRPGTAPQLVDELAAQSGTRRSSGSATMTTNNYYFARAPLMPMMDRTNSCRFGKVVSTTFATGQQQQQTTTPKVSRQDSASDSKAADKRLAVCICRRNSIESSSNSNEQQQQQQQKTCPQCQLIYRAGTAENEAVGELAASNSLARQALERQLFGESSLMSTLVRPAFLNNSASHDKQTLSSSSVMRSSRLAEGQKGQVGCSIGSSSSSSGNNKSGSIKSLPIQSALARNRARDKQAAENQIKIGTTVQAGESRDVDNSDTMNMVNAAASAAAAASAEAAMLVKEKKPQIVNKRLEIIREFIDTERAHTERLRCLDELFYRPLKGTDFVSSEQLKMVFSSHKTLYKIHKQIYRILLSASYSCDFEGVGVGGSGIHFYSPAPPRGPLIGSALLEIFEGSLKKRLERASCSFCAAQATNTELLNKLTRRDTKSGAFLAAITSQRMIGRLGIKDLLASCFQRLTKYPLLLENLLKATPQSVQEFCEDDFKDDDDEEEEEGEEKGAEVEQGENKAQAVAKIPSGAHRRRSKSGLSVQQRRAQMRLKLLVGDNLDDDDEDEDDDDDVDDEEDDDDDDHDEDYEGAGSSVEHVKEEEEELKEARRARLGAQEEARRNTRRMLAISLAEEREFIERALKQSRTILDAVNESIRVALARARLKEIWKRTDKYPGVPLIDITKQQVIHEGVLTLRLSKRSFDVYVLILNNYIIILTREGQDKYRLKFFTPEGKSAASALSSVSASVSSNHSSNHHSVSSNFMAASNSGNGGSTISAGSGQLLSSNNLSAANNGSASGNSGINSNLISNFSTNPYQTPVYSPVFLIDEHLATRDAATDENGFYLLCKRKDDSRIYEFASRSPAERIKWREKIQSMIDRQTSTSTSAASAAAMALPHRRPSCESTLTKSSSEISSQNGCTQSAGISSGLKQRDNNLKLAANLNNKLTANTSVDDQQLAPPDCASANKTRPPGVSRPVTPSSEPTKIVGTISYVFDDGIVPPSKMESSRVFVDQAIQVNILDGSTTMRQAQQKTTLGSASLHRQL